MTPEGEEKKLVKDYLTSIGAYQFWPVQTGYGRDTVDCIACIYGAFWGIEVKSETGKATKRQLIRLNEMEAAGAKVVIGTAAIIISIIRQYESMLSD